MKTEEELIQSAIYSNPYKHFYKIQRFKEVDEETGVNIEDYEDSEYNEDVHREYLEELFEIAKDEKEPYMIEAMRHDPAFMVDPVEEYYKPLIKRSLSEDQWNALSEEQILEIVSILDPVTWGERNLLQKSGLGGKWSPRNSRRGIPYQSMMIRCKAKNIAARAGRRIGKSNALVARILHRAFTWTASEGKPTFNIVIFTPNQSQINVIFKMMEVMIDSNPHMLSMVGRESSAKGKIPTRKNPQTLLELTNGVTIFGFVSGSSAIRGSAADLLVLDEGSFLTTDDTDAVVALLNEHEDVEFWVSSTPKGLKDYFYERVHDKDTVDFYFPTDKFHPGWSHQMETTFRSQLTDAGYKHEVLADFSADGEGIFQHGFVDAARTDYEYDDCKRLPTWSYGIGVDWNDTENGVQIVVVGYNHKYQEEGTKPYRIVDKAHVSIEGMTQTTAVYKVRELNRKWRCSTIYCDYGFGQAQVERLHELGQQSMPGTIDHTLVKAKSVNFSEKFVIRDPWLKKKVKKPAKPYMIGNAVRVFEEFNIEFPRSDDMLKRQLLGYTLKGVTPMGIPTYEKDPKVGDHQLDALVLCLLGFHMEFGGLAKPVIAGDLGVTSLGLPLGKAAMGPKNAPLNEHDRRLAADKKAEAEEVEWANKKIDITNLNQQVKVARRKSPSKGKRQSFMTQKIHRRSF